MRTHGTFLWFRSNRICDSAQDSYRQHHPTLWHLRDTFWEYGRSPSLRAPAEHGVSSYDLYLNSGITALRNVTSPQAPQTHYQPTNYENRLTPPKLQERVVFDLVFFSNVLPALVSSSGLLREALFPSMLHIKFCCPSVRPSRDNWVLRRGTEGSFTAAVYWWFEVLILKDPKVNSSQGVFSICRFRDPFSAPVWSSFCKMHKKTMFLHIRPGTAPLGKFFSNWRFLTLCRVMLSKIEYLVDHKITLWIFKRQSTNALYFQDLPAIRLKNLWISMSWKYFMFRRLTFRKINTFWTVLARLRPFRRSQSRILCPKVMCPASYRFHGPPTSDVTFHGPPMSCVKIHAWSCTFWVIENTLPR